MNFILKDGTGLNDKQQITGPPYLAHFSIRLDDVPTLREQASLLLRASGGDARRFLASILKAGTIERPTVSGSFHGSFGRY